MVMRKHQRYFPLYKPATQDLLPHFITIANGPIDIPTVKVDCLCSCLSQLPTSLPCTQLALAVLYCGAYKCPLPCSVSKWHQLALTVLVSAAAITLGAQTPKIMHVFCLVSHVGMHAARHLMSSSSTVLPAAGSKTAVFYAAFQLEHYPTCYIQNNAYSNSAATSNIVKLLCGPSFVPHVI